MCIYRICCLIISWAQYYLKIVYFKKNGFSFRCGYLRPLFLEYKQPYFNKKKIITFSYGVKWDKFYMKTLALDELYYFEVERLFISNCLGVKYSLQVPSLF